MIARVIYMQILSRRALSIVWNSGVKGESSLIPVSAANYLQIHWLLILQDMFVWMRALTILLLNFNRVTG